MSELATLGYVLLGFGMFDIVRRAVVRSTFGPIIRADDPIAFWGVMSIFGALGCVNIAIAISRFFGILA